MTLDVTVLGILLASTVLLIIGAGVLRDDSLLIIPAVLFWFIGLGLTLQDVTKTEVLAVGNTTVTQTVVLSTPYKTMLGLVFIIFGTFLFYAAYYGGRES
jgi:hypothetical protein